MTNVTLKLGGRRLVAAADWMMGKPCPEEIDPEGGDWYDQGASVISGVLTIPAHRVADFIGECQDGIVTMEDIAAGVTDWDDGPSDNSDAKATARALQTIIDKLHQLVNPA